MKNEFLLCSKIFCVMYCEVEIFPLLHPAVKLDKYVNFP